MHRIGELSLFVLAAVLVAGMTPIAAVGGPPGLGVVRVKNVPNGKTLSPGRLNVVPVHSGWGFIVGLRNDDVSRQLRVLLKIEGGPLTKPITKSARVSLRPGEHATVGIRDIGPIAFAERLSLSFRVVDPKHSGVWATAKYPIIFSLG